MGPSAAALPALSLPLIFYSQTGRRHLLSKIMTSVIRAVIFFKEEHFGPFILSMFHIVFQWTTEWFGKQCTGANA